MKVLKNAFWLTAGRITGDLSSFVLFVSLSRAFGPGTTGEYSYSFALGSILAFLACGGFDEYGTALYARASGHAERRALWSDIITTQYTQLALSALCFAAFLLLSGGTHARPIVIIELGALLTGQYLGRTLFIPSMAAQQMKRPAIIDFSCRFGAIVCALAGIFVVRAPLPALLIGFPVAGAAYIGLAARNARGHGVSLLPHLDVRRIVRTLRGTSPFTASELLSQFYSRTDFLLIAFLLGNASVGLYATDMKFVEYGVIPLYLLGVAAYPSLTRAAAFDPATFADSVRELTRLLLFLSGWVAVGLFCLVPLLIVPIFGPRFADSAVILPWFAALALLKGAEATLYRVAYAVRRPSAYFIAILAGTALTIALNFALIPRLGLVGAVIATIASVAVALCACAVYLRRSVAPTMLLGAIVRVSLALAATAAVVTAAEHAGARPWLLALAGCGSYPLFGLGAGLLPRPARSRLLHAKGAEANPLYAAPRDTSSA